MDFWKAYSEKVRLPEFGSSQTWLKTGERWNTSIMRYLEYSYILGAGEHITAQWSPDIRYIIAKEIISDLFISLYDVNTRSVFACRIGGDHKSFSFEASKAVRKIRNPNIEMRAIGLQNTDKQSADAIMEMRNAIGTGSLAEADLFGNQKRHIIMELYTGRMYNLLLENRIYRPGELMVLASKPEIRIPTMQPATKTPPPSK